MKRVTGMRSLAILGQFALLLLSLAIALGIGAGNARAAAGGDIRVIVGMHTYEATVSPHADSCGTSYWHCDEAGRPANTGLDLLNAVGPTATAVSFQSYTSSGYAYGTILNHTTGGSLCPGADVFVWIPYPNSSTGTWVGSIDFVQVGVTQTFGTQFTIGSGWTIQAIGNIYSSAPGGGCPWTGAHLHQSGTPGPNVWTNWNVEDDDDPNISGRQISPTGSSSTNWLHWIWY